MSQSAYTSDDVILLLGAGASVDAGMPTIKDLTLCIRERLPNLKDVNGKTGFDDLFDSLVDIDPDVGINYERFFEYIRLINKISKGRAKNLVSINLTDFLLDRAGHIEYVIGDMVRDIFYNLHELPYQHYFYHLSDFIFASGRLKIFTTNYDLCLESECRGHGINVTTGFNDSWQPVLFSSEQSGINLYKLHGSLNWITGPDNKIGETKEIQKEKACEIVLGPGSKIQTDDPFITLFCELHKAMQTAKVCVVIGYGYQDDHINSVIEKGICPVILDVNIQSHHSYLGAIGRKRIELVGSAKSLLSNGAIMKKLLELLKNRA